MATLAELLRENNPNAVVQDIYRNVLGREADPSAYSWANQINSDEPNSIAELARRISASEEGKAYSSTNPDSQWNYLSNISRENAPTTAFDASGMQYLGGNSYIDRAGNKIQIDENGEAVSYSPSESWYDQQLAQNPDALRGMNYRNQTYLASGPLQQTMNFQGKEIPMQVAEYQVDPQTGKFIKGATGENVPVRMKDPEYNMWDDWAAPVAVVGVPLAMSYAAPYLAGEAALTTTGAGAGDVFAGYSATGSAAGTAGSTVPAGYGAGAAGSGSWGLSPELASELGLDYSTSGLSTSGAQGSATLDAMGLNSGGGLSAMQKAQLIRSGANALGQAFGGSGTEGMSSGGGGSSAGGYNYANMPYLANPQQNQTFMKTGADVSGSGTTITGMPVQLDTTRHNILMANLLRG
jgi:hypothetical protein